MTTEQRQPAVVLSYRTRDSRLRDDLVLHLSKLGVSAEFLPHLTHGPFAGGPDDSPSSLNSGGWVEHFVEMFECSVGLISIVSTSGGSGSVALEKALAKTSPEGDERVFFLRTATIAARQYTRERWRQLMAERAPAARALAEFRRENASALEHFDRLGRDLPRELQDELDALETAAAFTKPVVEELEGPDELSPEDLSRLDRWLEGRVAAGPCGRLPRVSSEEVNVAKPYDDHVMKYSEPGKGGPAWFAVSVRDLYDCVWLCRRCFTLSDVWMKTESRPPQACPACGYEGRW